MTEKWGWEATTEDLLAGTSLSGMRILVTGVSSGIGLETARALVAHGAEVVGTVRDPAAAEAAVAPVREAARAGGGRLDLVPLDLGALASVRACADTLLAEGRLFDRIICNVGVMAHPGHTVDGFDVQFGTNHLGHFALVSRLAARLAEGGRLVTLTSAGHQFSDVDLGDPNFERRPYDNWLAYGQSKTANILFAVAFDRRHRERGVRAAAVHPGIIATRLSRHQTERSRAELVEAHKRRGAASGNPTYRLKSAEQGAATTIWAAITATPEEMGGQYCEDCHAAPVNAEGDDGVRGYAVDPDRADALWALSEAMVGERFT